MDSLARLAAIVGCEQAIHRFYAALDAADMETVAAALAEDGVWHRQGEALRGPGDASRALAKRPAGRTTAHLVQNLVVDVEDASTACASYMTLVYRVDVQGPVDGPVPLGAPLAISMNRDRWRLDAGVWRVVEKRGSRKFGA